AATARYPPPLHDALPISAPDVPPARVDSPRLRQVPPPPAPGRGAPLRVGPVLARRRGGGYDGLRDRRVEGCGWPGRPRWARLVPGRPPVTRSSLRWWISTTRARGWAGTRASSSSCRGPCRASG